MISPIPWDIDLSECIIRDSDGAVIYEAGRGFTHMDDCEFAGRVLIQMFETWKDLDLRGLRSSK